MNTLSYSFILAMLHSLWQAGVLWLLYKVFSKWLIPANQPLARRNLLYLAISIQLLLFVATLLIYSMSGSTAPSFLIATSSVGISAAGINTLSNWLFYSYTAVIIFKCIKAVYNWQQFRRQAQIGLEKAPVDLRIFSDQRAFQFGIKRKVSLWLSHSINTPVTYGFFKPVILLPVALLNHISTKQAESLIVHELVHIRNNDYLLNWVLLVAESVFFFNPFIRSCCRTIRLEREKSCDLNVIAFNYSALSYAETLLMAERIKQVIPAFQLAAVQKKQQLLQRIRFFSQSAPAPSKRIMPVSFPLFAGLAGAIIFSSVLFLAGNIATRDKMDDLADAGSSLAAVIPAQTDDYTIDLVGLKTFANDITRKVAPVIEAQKPVLERKLASLKPVLEQLQRKAKELSEDLEKEYSTIPVSNTEVDSIGSEIIVQEESAGTNGGALKMYRMVYRNGEWKLVPEWMITANEVKSDTLSNRKKDSSKKRILPPQ